MKYLLVFGSREWTNKQIIEQHIKDYNPNVVIQGGAKGADLIAKEIAVQNKIECIEFPADWKNQGKKAGYLRNKEMLDFLLFMQDQGHEIQAFGFKCGKISKGTDMMYGLLVQHSVHGKMVSEVAKSYGVL